LLFSPSFFRRKRGEDGSTGSRLIQKRGEEGKIRSSYRKGTSVSAENRAEVRKEKGGGRRSILYRLFYLERRGEKGTLDASLYLRREKIGKTGREGGEKKFIIKRKESLSLPNNPEGVRLSHKRRGISGTKNRKKKKKGFQGERRSLQTGGEDICLSTRRRKEVSSLLRERGASTSLRGKGGSTKKREVFNLLRLRGGRGSLPLSFMQLGR